LPAASFEWVKEVLMSRSKLFLSFGICSLASWTIGFIMAAIAFALLASQDPPKQPTGYTPKNPVPARQISLADPDPGEK
jgi:hypothetical protein